jgi:hypothetical protein
MPPADDNVEPDEDDTAEYIAPGEQPESLGTFGRAESEEELAELDLPPIPFTIIGYAVEADEDGKHAETAFEFHVRPTQSFGPLFNALQQTDSRGNIPMPAAVRYIGSALIAAERDRWQQTLDDPLYEFRAEALGEMAQALAERYGLRPTQSRRARRATQRRTGRTTGGGRAVTASGSRTSTRQPA